MIKYLLRENPLTANPDDRMAQEVDARSYSQEEIVEEMMKRGTSLTRADIAAYQKLEAEVYADIIAGGGHINTPILNTNFSISGVFENQEDSFDRERHTLKLNVTAGSALKEAALRAKLQKVEGSNTDPSISGVTDKISGSKENIKVGSVMEIRGSRLKFDAADGDQGVFILIGNDSYRCDTVIENMPARLIVMIPATLPEGECTIEVRTKITSNNVSGKFLKTGKYNKALTAIK